MRGENPPFFDHCDDWCCHRRHCWVSAIAAVSFLPPQPWTGALAHPWDDARGDVLVVLGNEVSPDNLVGLKTYWRSVYAVEAWREGGFREIIVSGGEGISSAMRAFLISSGVPAAVIREEPESHTTRENALFVTRMLGTALGKSGSDDERLSHVPRLARF